ncbi:Cytochrome c oxidase subunit 5B, mitochondrial [Cryptotrichosporon argae]
MSVLRTASSALRLRAPRLARAASTAAPLTVTSTRTNASAPLLANIEASWKSLPAEEQYEVYQQLEEIQKRDWKELSIDEKKAAYFVAFGPHGPREPYTPPGQNGKVLIGTLAGLGVAFTLFALVRSQAPPNVRTWTKEYQQASTQRMQEENVNPISGVSSSGYKGKGMIMTED